MNTESGSRKPDSTQSEGKDIVQEERERIENHQNEEKQKEIKKGNEIIQERVNTEESGSTKPDSTQTDEFKDFDQEDIERTKKLERERLEKHLQNEEKQIEINNAIVSELERIRSKQIHDQNVLAKRDSTNEIPGTFHFIINNL